jgi:hypothetical protein
MSDLRLEPVMRERIANSDYDAVFTAGGCFIFALQLHERFSYKIRGVRSSNVPRLWGHVWAQKGKMGVDVRGVYPEELVAALANGGAASDIMDVSAEAVRAEIAKEEYPARLLEEIRALADWVFDSHERFALARPVRPETAALLSTLIEEADPPEAILGQLPRSAPSLSPGAPQL